MPDEVIAVFHVIAGYQATLKRNNSILLILSDMNVNNRIVLRSDFNAFVEFMSCKQHGAVMSHLEDADDTLAITDGQHGQTRVDLDRGQT